MLMQCRRGKNVWKILVIGTGMISTIVGLLLIFNVNVGSQRKPSDTNFSHTSPNAANINQDDEPTELLRTLNDKRIRKFHPERIFEAISKLGTMKCVQAVQPLAKLLDFENTAESKQQPGMARTVAWGPVFLSQRYPAIEALISIGKPAVDGLVKAIENEESGSVRSDNAIYTIRQIYRDNVTAGIECLSQAKDHAFLDGIRRKRLELAILKLNQK